ncbi:MAG: hypothetical protein H7039_10245 [Bryobacteraceae bacterium]|nr:hypothetical protein [Bryobacteraceae bacterium]
MRLLLLCVLATPLVAAERGINFYSIDAEREKGAKVAARLAAELSIVQDPDLLRALQTYARSISSEYDWKIQVFHDGQTPVHKTQSDLILPFDDSRSEILSVAGGWLFVPLRTIAEATSERQFASAVAHAITHVTLRHGTRLSTRRQVVSLANHTLERNDFTGLRNKVPDPAGPALQAAASTYETDTNRYAKQLVEDTEGSRDVGAFEAIRKAAQRLRK